MAVGTGTGIEVFGESRIIGELLGAGGEGQVFALGRDGDRNRPLALKWYHANVASPERRSAIRELVKRGAPSEAFLWPLGMIEGQTDDQFGYVMDLRPDGFIGLAALLRGQVVRNEASIARFAFDLSLAFRALHLRGLCYRDINFGNAFMHQQTGAALICDNDNVCVEGVGHAHVLGSKKFMAPEIVRGEALPSKFTDRFSLAVMLFYLLVVHHPLEGKLTESGLADAASDIRHFGTHAVFCFDPHETKNSPHPEWHGHVEGLWNNLPEAIRALFIRSFTVGLHEPTKRVVDSEWCSALADLRSGIHTCSTCQGSLNLGSNATRCGRCHAEIEPTLVLEVGSGTTRRVVATSGAQITEHHTTGNLNFDKILATVETHPTDPTRLGLRNDTDHGVQLRAVDGTTHEVPPGRRCEVLAGSRISFGNGSFSVTVSEST